MLRIARASSALSSPGAAFGAAIGLIVANVMMSMGLIGRSFADYEEWEEKALAELEAKKGESGESEPSPGANTPGMWVQYPHARR